MSEKAARARDDARIFTFPAPFLPILAAWNCRNDLPESPTWHMSGALIAPGPEDGQIYMVATDGSNMIRLEGRGHCKEPFGFRLPQPLVAACMLPPGREMVGPGYIQKVDWPGWLQPHQVTLTDLPSETSAFVSAEEACPQNEDLVLAHVYEIKRASDLEEYAAKADLPSRFRVPGEDAEPGVYGVLPPFVLQMLAAIGKSIQAVAARSGYWWIFEGGIAYTSHFACNRCRDGRPPREIPPAIAKLPSGSPVCAECFTKHGALREALALGQEESTP